MKPVNTNAVLALVFYIILKLTFLIYKYACLADNNNYHIKKSYYFYKYYKPLNPKGRYSLIYSLKLHFKREYNIDWIIAKNKSYIIFVADSVNQGINTVRRIHIACTIGWSINEDLKLKKRKERDR